MEAKDLMIGNFVKVNNGLGKDDLFKVVRIVDSEDNGWVDLSNDSLSNEFAIGHTCNEIEPIPLTDDFWLKNEFVYQKDDNSYTLFDDYYSINAKEVNYGMWQIVVKHEICFVSYIHQLQQFLNLCGINKEIKP